MKSRTAANTRLLLEHKGYELFYPVRREIVKKQKKASNNGETPLFPGYLFCRLRLADRHAPVVTTPGVVQIVGFGSGPTPIPDDEIETIQRVVRSGFDVKPHEYLHSGQHVELIAGPLAGVRGIVNTISSHSSLIVSISLLQRSLSVEVHPDWIAPIRPAGLPAAAALSSANRC